MTQPVWITSAGSLGTIAENVFYQYFLLASSPPIGAPIIISATSATNNAITCSSTAGLTTGLEVEFSGTNFGGLQENVRYYVLNVLTSTTFTISDHPDSTNVVTLTTATGYMTALFYEFLFYEKIAGTLPDGIQLTANGTIAGVPKTIVNVQGVPADVASDVTSKFVIRAYTKKTVNGVQVVDRIADRTFTITVTGNNVPYFITPAGSIGTYYDADYVNIQIDYNEGDAVDTTLIRLISGELPPGVTVSSTGLLTGYIQPAPDETQSPGYDLTPIATTPYDFVVSAISKNYQFELEITDGKGVSSNIRTFTIFVYNREDLTADDTIITADTTFITADVTPERAPFLLNFNPSNLGIVRSDNYYAYRFIGQDYDADDVEYVISADETAILPPGLILDKYTGWYYGYIQDQGVTEIEYSFYIQVRARSLVCTATSAATNLITCDTTTRADIYVGAEVVFEGETFGGIVAGTTYYVASIISDTQFSISTTFAGAVYPLSTATGEMLAVPVDIPSSQLYPFTLTITGAIEREVTWLTDAYLGSIENGSTSMFKVAAVNAGGRELYYRLASGDYNLLPQGLQLLPSGEIAGRVSFNTFAVDAGTTTFDKSGSTISGREETTFDMTFTFTVNAYATDPEQPVYRVSSISVIDGGSGYGTGNTAPIVSIAAPTGLNVISAQAGNVTVSVGAITEVDLVKLGYGYTTAPTVTVTQGYGGVGAELEAVMELAGEKEIISVYKTFTIKLVRAYNKPYQNLFILAMPPQNDRELLNSLLTNQTIFPTEFIYRPDDVNFGLSTRVDYQHAFGLAPETLDTYVSSLYENHYWKNLVLGEIATAQALDDSGNVVYEVVYSKVIDNLVNAAGQSVSKIVNLPYPVYLDDSTVVIDVYPNSLINMRDQVIDVVGQISTKLPLWMTSKQTNGRVLGFTPAWVICYTNPGRSAQVAYNINTYFGEQLNKIDFKVDRYELDTELSKNWDPETQSWVPTPSLTTFDRIDTIGYTDLGLVDACTELAFCDIQGRTRDYINNLGGLDGPTWFSVPGEDPPYWAQVIIRDGDKIIFVKQENYNDPPGSIENAWSDYLVPYDEGLFDAGDVLAAPDTFDYGALIPGGYAAVCSATDSTTDLITCESTLNMSVGDRVWFTGTTFGGIETETADNTIQGYYVYALDTIACTATTASTDRITCSDTSSLSVDDAVWFSTATLGDIGEFQDSGLPKQYYIANINSATQFQISETIGGSPVSLTDGGDGSTIMVMVTNKFQVATTKDATGPLELTTDTGAMNVNYGNYRMSLWEVNTSDDGIVTLTQSTQTITDDFVTSTQGVKYANGTYMYVPGAAIDGTRISWQPLITATTTISSQTTFDQNSLQFIEPVDMYNTTDAYDKYLVFPKTNILA